MKKFLVITIGIVLVSALGYFTFLYNATYSEGVRSGELIKFSNKGMVFKTYEGKLIQSGFRSSGKTAGSTIQSYEFEFSVENEGIADTLMLSSGKDMELHYREYKGVLPWRGFSKYVVDKIIKIEKQDPATVPF